MEKAKTKNKEVVATKAAEQTVSHEANRPVKTYRDKDVSASVWARTIVKLEPRTYYSISIERSYQNAKGEWKYTNFFNLTDGQKIVSVWQQAAEFIEEEMRQQAAARAAGQEAE